MKKTLLFVACVFAFVGLVQAQSNKISWGSEFDTKEKVDNLVGETEEAVFGLGIAEYGEYKTLFIFDSKTLNLTQEKKLDLPKIEGKRPKAVGAKVFGGKCYIFALVGSDSKGTLYAISVDAKGVFANNPKKIFEQQKLSINHSFLFQLSDDKSHLLVSLLNIFDTAWGVALYYPAISSVFEENFELVHTVTPKPIDGDKYTAYMFRRATIDNNGNIFFLFHKGTPGALQSYEIFNYSVDKQAFNYSIDPARVLSKVKEETSLTMDFFEINSDGDLCLGGHYLSKGKVGMAYYIALKGTYFVKIDNSQHKIVSSESFPLTKGVEEVLLIKDVNTAVQGGASSVYSMKKIIKDENGGVIMISENESGPLYGAILITCFGEDGNVTWSKAIAKRQNSYKEQKRMNYSLAVSEADKSIDLFYNDNAISSSTNATMSSVKEANGDIEELKIIAVSMSLDGKDFEKKELGNALNDGVAMCPKTSIEGKDGGILLFGECKKVKKLGRIKL